MTQKVDLRPSRFKWRSFQHLITPSTAQKAKHLNPRPLNLLRAFKKSDICVYTYVDMGHSNCRRVALVLQRRRGLWRHVPTGRGLFVVVVAIFSIGILRCPSCNSTIRRLVDDAKLFNMRLL